MSRLNEKDKELTITGKNINLSDPKNAYMGGEFLTNPKDYIEVLIYDVNENFLESAIVNEDDYLYDSETGIKLKTGSILRKMGYDRGKFIVKYNFLRQVAGSYENVALDEDNNIVDYVQGETRLKEYKYFIHEISATRTEVRLAVQNINEDQYLRDFLYSQKSKKRVRSDGTGDSGIRFLGEANGEPPYADSIKMKMNGGQFLNEMIGGTISFPNAFITRFTQVFPPPVAGGDVSETETIGDIRARFYLDLGASTDYNEGDVFFGAAYDVFSNDGNGYTDNDALPELGPNGKALDDTLDFVPSGMGDKMMSTIRNLHNNDFNPVETGYEGGGDTRIVLRSNSTLAFEGPTTYTWELAGWDRDGSGYGASYHEIQERVGDEGNDFNIEVVTGDTTVAVQDAVNRRMARTEDSVDGSTFIFKLYSKDVHVGVKLTVNQALGEGSSASSFVWLPCIIHNED